METGEIESIGIYNYQEFESEINYIDENTIVEIIKPILDELDIEIDLDNMQIAYLFNNNVIVDFYKDKDYIYTFSVDYINKKNLFFRKQYYENFRGE